VQPEGEWKRFDRSGLRGWVFPDPRGQGPLARTGSHMAALPARRGLRRGEKVDWPWPAQRPLRGGQIRRPKVADGSVTTLRETNLGGRYATYTRHPARAAAMCRSPVTQPQQMVDGGRPGAAAAGWQLSDISFPWICVVGDR